MPEYLVRSVADLKENKKKVVSAGITNVLVLRPNGKLVGFQDKCVHAERPLEKGAICKRKAHLVCPWHMRTFFAPQWPAIDPPALE